MLARGAGRLRWVREQFAFLIVFLLVAAAFVYLLVEPGHWVRGTGAIAAAMLVGGLLRLVLPAALAGSLAVRGRCTDAFCYLLVGGLILAVDIRLHR